MGTASVDSRQSLPPGPDLAPSRQTAAWVMRPLAFLQGLQERYGDVFTLRLADERPWVVVSDPELIKSVFLAPPDVLQAGGAKPVLEPILGTSSLMMLDGPPHMAQRRLLLPPFHGDRVGRYEGVMRAIMEAELDRWPAGVAEPAAPRMRAVALEVIVRTIFGVSDDERVARMSRALDDLHLPANSAEGRAPAFLQARERVAALLLEEIARHRADPASEHADDILSLLLQARHEDGSPMSTDEILDQLMTLLVAGHETAATTLSWALELLVRSPEALERATAEARTDGGSAYVDAVILETLRMRPPILVVPRVVASEPFDLAGSTLPPGTVIAPCALLLHHRPDVYPDPEAFRPARFLDRPPGTYTWIPFGGGVRRCIGASFALFQMRVLLSTLLARFDVTAADPEPESMRCRTVTLTPSRGARVVVEPRTGSSAG